MRRKAALFSRLFDATDRNERVPGIRRAWSMGFNIYRQHEMGSNECLEKTYMVVQVAFSKNQLPQSPFD